MVELAARQPGFLGIESARENLGITVSYWDSLEAIRNWKQNAEHREAQRLGHQQWYSSFRERIAIDYWQLPEDARLREVIIAVRADEAKHRDLNHGFAGTTIG